MDLSLSWPQMIGSGLALMIAGAGILLLGFAAISKALSGKPSPDLGYHDPTINDSSIWTFFGLVFLAAAGYLAIHVMTAG